MKGSWQSIKNPAQEMSILHPEAEVLAPGTPLRSSLHSERSSRAESAVDFHQGWKFGIAGNGSTDQTLTIVS